MKLLLGIVFILVQSAMAGELQDKLYAQLEGGALTFTNLEMVLIVEGVVTRGNLANYVDAYESLLEELKLTGKQAKAKETKRARTLHKKLFRHLKVASKPGEGLLALLDDASYTPLTATIVFTDLCTRAGLRGNEHTSIKEKLDPYFAGGKGTVKQVIAAHLCRLAVHLGDPRAKEIPAILRLSTQLDPGSNYGKDELDKHFYNRSLTLYNAGAYLSAAQMVIGGMTRYPAEPAFGPLAFNAGVKLFSLESIDEQSATQLARQLFEGMGAHQAEFETVMNHRQYNLAANLYNQKKYEAAVIELERVKIPPDLESFNRVLASTYALLAEKRLEQDDAAGGEHFMVKLAELDADRAAVLRHRLAQLKLKKMVDSGQLERALADAATRLDTDIDRKNYKSVLVQFNQGLRASGAYEKALAALDNQPDLPGLAESAANLRFNTYDDWLQSFEAKDVAHLLPIYARMLKDKQLKMSAENATIIKENHGNALYLEINRLIEERKFEQADQKARAALKILPNHPLLIEIGQKAATILRRISK